MLAGTLSIGSLVAFYGFVTQLFDPLSGASELYARAQKTFASIRQVQAAFALRPTVTNARGSAHAFPSNTRRKSSLPLSSLDTPGTKTSSTSPRFGYNLGNR